MNIDRLEIPDDPQNEDHVIASRGAQAAELVSRSLGLGRVKKIVCRSKQKTIEVHPKVGRENGYVAESITD